MKKFLSIITLACLLALGMALPAAAVGESTLPQLYVQAVDKTGKPEVGITVPAGIVRDVKFYINGETGYTEVETKPEVEDTTIVKVIETEKGYAIKGVAQGETTVAIHDDNGPITRNVTILVPQSSLEVSFDNGGSWDSSEEGLSAEVSYPVMFRFGANAPNIPGAETVFVECDPEEITVEPASGLVLRDGVMIASKMGEYTLRYQECSEYPVKVNVEYQGTADVTVDELENLKKSQSEFLDFLKTEKGYCGSGNFTLRLPEQVGSVECSNGLTDGTLTLKGAENGTSIESLKVTAENIAVENITFTGNAGISLHSVNQFEAKNCTFRDVPFHVYTDSNGAAPLLKLTDNKYFATDFANIYDNQNVLMGTWQINRNGKPDDAEWYLGNYHWDNPGGQLRAFWFYVDPSVNALIKEGWKFEFRHPCFFNSVYTTLKGARYVDIPDPRTCVIPISGDDNYAVVDGTYPKLSDKNEVVLRQVDAEYLRMVTVDTTFTNATVTHNSKQVDASVNNKKLTFHTNGAGTYKVTATTTATTTKSSTTSRTYKYTYQDFYQVTPAGFTNAMRYVKDNLVTLNCTEAGSRSISLPVASMAAAAEKGYSVLVKTKNAELTLDAAALKSIAQQAKGTTVLLHYKSLNHKTLTTVGQASIQSHLAQFPGDNADLAFLVTATSDSETIEDLQMGTITLRIPFILLPGTEGMANTVYALQSESIAEARATTVADGHLTTTLLDLTEHMVFLTSQAPQSTEETTVPAGETMEPTVETIAETTQPETVPETTQPPVETEKQGGSPILTIVIVLGVVLVIGGGALGFLLLRRRFHK